MRAQDQTDDREAPIGLGVERVAAIPLSVAVPLLGREHRGRGEMLLELVRHERDCPPPDRVPVHDVPNGRYELVQASGRDGSAVAHHGRAPTRWGRWAREVIPASVPTV